MLHGVKKMFGGSTVKHLPTQINPVLRRKPVDHVRYFYRVVGALSEGFTIGLGEAMQIAPTMKMSLVTEHICITDNNEILTVASDESFSQLCTAHLRTKEKLLLVR